MLKKDNIDLTFLSSAIADLKKGIVFCSICHNMAEIDPCSTCSDEKRDKTTICVVEEPLDALAIDRTGHFKGVFHVLGGVLNPLEGIGPEQLQIQSLIDRIHPSSPLPKSGPLRARESETREGKGEVEIVEVKEIIIATNPSLEGETTAMHIAKVIKQEHPYVKITRIARGLPTGGDLEYADDITLMRALEGRREY